MSRWYKFKPTPFAPPKSPGEAREELLALYKRAIRRQLISDVPVGLLLSGGIDSGLLLALMNLNGNSWPTYTVGYGSTLRRRRIGGCRGNRSRAGLEAHQRHDYEIIFEEALPKIVASLEEPIATSSIVPMYFVCERARQDVKVALVGQGPDELFGGYRRHLGVRYGALWARLPELDAHPDLLGISALPRNETLKRGVYSLAIPDRMRRYQHVLSLLPGEQVDGLFQEGCWLQFRRHHLECWADLTDLMRPPTNSAGFSSWRCGPRFPDELLMYADKLSMAHGLELRVPFVDKEIVEYVERLPANLK